MVEIRGRQIDRCLLWDISVLHESLWASLPAPCRRNDDYVWTILIYSHHQRFCLKAKGLINLMYIVLSQPYVTGILSSLEIFCWAPSKRKRSGTQCPKRLQIMSKPIYNRFVDCNILTNRKAWTLDRPKKGKLPGRTWHRDMHTQHWRKTVNDKLRLRHQTSGRE